MNKEKVLSLIRSILTLAGSYLIGKNVFGTVADASFAQEATGAIMVLVSLIWGIVDKTTTIEMVQTSIMQVLKFIGGFLVAKGKISLENLDTLIGIATGLAAIIYGRYSYQKNQKIASGDIDVSELKGLKK
jgi:hypothetical protein